MRTNINTVTNCNVFGLAQDRAVSLWNDSCAYAAQHLASRHASKRAHGLAKVRSASGSRYRGHGWRGSYGQAERAWPLRGRNGSRCD